MEMKKFMTKLEEYLVIIKNVKYLKKLDDQKISNCYGLTVSDANYDYIMNSTNELKNLKLLLLCIVKEYMQKKIFLKIQKF